MPLSVCQCNYILSQSIYCVSEAYTTKLTNKCWICILFRNLPLLEGKYILCAGRKLRHSLHCSEGMAIGCAGVTHRHPRAHTHTHKHTHTHAHKHTHKHTQTKARLNAHGQASSKCLLTPNTIITQRCCLQW